MTDKTEQIRTELESLRKSLYKISPDAIRAMSTHETDDEVQAMRRRLDQTLDLLNAS